MVLTKSALRTLRRQLKTGDYTLAAERLAGEYSRQYVAMVARGERHNARILHTLLAIAEERRAERQQLSERISQLAN